MLFKKKIILGGHAHVCPPGRPGADLLDVQPPRGGGGEPWEAQQVSEIVGQNVNERTFEMDKVNPEECNPVSPGGLSQKANKGELRELRCVLGAPKGPAVNWNEHTRFLWKWGTDEIQRARGSAAPAALT